MWKILSNNQHIKKMFEFNQSINITIYAIF